MLSDLARWSDSTETECVERAIRSLWYAVVLKDGVVNAWVGTMKRVRAIIDPPTRPDALSRLRRTIEVGGPPSASESETGALGDEALGGWFVTLDA
jgi:hypothetical protein